MGKLTFSIRISTSISLRAASNTFVPDSLVVLANAWAIVEFNFFKYWGVMSGSLLIQFGAPILPIAGLSKRRNRRMH